MRGRPCLRQENVKLYTLFKTEDPENDTLTGGTSLYIGNIWEYPPPPPPTHTHTPTRSRPTKVLIKIARIKQKKFFDFLRPEYQ